MLGIKRFYNRMRSVDFFFFLSSNLEVTYIPHVLGEESSLGFFKDVL